MWLEYRHSYVSCLIFKINTIKEMEYSQYKIYVSINLWLNTWESNTKTTAVLQQKLALRNVPHMKTWEKHWYVQREVSTWKMAQIAYRVVSKSGHGTVELACHSYSPDIWQNVIDNLWALAVNCEGGIWRARSFVGLEIYGIKMRQWARERQIEREIEREIQR